MKIAIIGTGWMAERFLKVTSLVDGVSAVAVVSASQDRSEKFSKKCTKLKPYTSIENMINNVSVDAVYIANTNVQHVDSCIEAIEAGLSVLCEKPLATNYNDAQRVINLARKKKVLLLEGYWTLYLPSYQKLLQIVEQNELGTASYLRSEFGTKVEWQQNASLSDPIGGGVILDRGGYLAALAIKTLGPIINLEKTVVKDDSGIDTSVYFQTIHKTGARATMAASFDLEFPNHIDLTFDSGLVEMSGGLLTNEVFRISQTCRQGIGVHEKSTLSTLKSKIRQVGLIRNIHRMLSPGQFVSYGKDIYQAQLKNFVNLHQTKNIESNVVTHELSLNVADLLNELRKA